MYGNLFIFGNYQAPLCLRIAECSLIDFFPELRSFFFLKVAISLACDAGCCLLPVARGRFQWLLLARPRCTTSCQGYHSRSVSLSCCEWLCCRRVLLPDFRRFPGSVSRCRNGEQRGRRIRFRSRPPPAKSPVLSIFIYGLLLRGFKLWLARNTYLPQGPTTEINTI